MLPAEGAVVPFAWASREVSSASRVLNSASSELVEAPLAREDMGVDVDEVAVVAATGGGV